MKALGAALRHLKRYDTAANVLQAAVGLDPQDADARVALAEVLERLERKPDAVEHYEAAARLSPDRFETHVEFGRLLCDLGRDADALRPTQRAIDLGAATPLLYMRLGRAHAATGDVQRASAAYLRAAALAPTWSVLQTRVGHLSAARRRWKEAALLYDRAIRGLGAGRPSASSPDEAAQQKILRLVSGVHRIPAFIELARLLDAEGLPAEARVVRICLARLRTQTETPESRRSRTRSFEGRAGDAIVAPRLEDIPLMAECLAGDADVLAPYEEAFAPFSTAHVAVLVLGSQSGRALLHWRSFFKHGTIVGVDPQPVSLDDRAGRVRSYVGKQDDLGFLDHISSEAGPDGFDIVIDDGPYRDDSTRRTFDHVFEHHVKPGGVYLIEDWRSGYLPLEPIGEADSPQIVDPGMGRLVAHLTDHADAYHRVLFAGTRLFIFKKRVDLVSPSRARTATGS
jgi:tetratricopeptide (TPR) repeat protein